MLDWPAIINIRTGPPSAGIAQKPPSNATATIVKTLFLHITHHSFRKKNITVSSKHIEDVRDFHTYTLTLSNLLGTRFDVGVMQLFVIEEAIAEQRPI
jgi:competence transcription factor ComK